MFGEPVNVSECVLGEARHETPTGQCPPNTPPSFDRTPEIIYVFDVVPG